MLPSPQNSEEQPSTSGTQQDEGPSFKMRIKCSPKTKTVSNKAINVQRSPQTAESARIDNRNTTTDSSVTAADTPSNASGSTSNPTEANIDASPTTRELFAKIRSVRESLQNLNRDVNADWNFRERLSKDVCSRIIPIINSVPPQDRPHLLRLFRHKQQQFQLKRTYPVAAKKTNRRNLLGSSSDSSSSEEEGPKRIHLAR